MKLIQTKIEIGLQKPMRFLHITDSHLCLADGRDDLRKQELARRRYAEFGGDAVPQALEEQLDYAVKHHLKVLYTGDIIDFVSWQNLEYARQQLSRVDYFMAAGNHEFSLYVGEAKEDVPYKMQSYDRVQSYFNNNLLFANRVMGGVNFVAVDDGYYRFDKKQLAQLRMEAAKGLPMVLLLHNPLHTDELYHQMRQIPMGRHCAYLTGSPVSMMADYAPDRMEQQAPDRDTMAFIHEVEQEPLIKAVIAGHLHHSFEDRMESGVMQYVTGGGYRNIVREIEIV